MSAVSCYLFFIVFCWWKEHQQGLKGYVKNWFWKKWKRAATVANVILVAFSVLFGIGLGVHQYRKDEKAQLTKQDTLVSIIHQSPVNNSCPVDTPKHIPPRENGR